MGYTVRDATPADAQGMGRVNVRAWQVGYVGLLPQDYLDDRDPHERAAWWLGELRAGDPLRRNLVADEAGEVIGFASFGRVRITGGDDWTGEAEPGVGELTVLNVHPDRWSAGVGSALLAAVDAGLGELGFTEAVLWVITGNARARRFYEFHGWRPDGGTLYSPGERATFHQVRYRRPVGRAG